MRATLDGARFRSAEGSDEARRYRKAKAQCEDRQFDAADRTLDGAFLAIPKAVDGEDGSAAMAREKSLDELEKLRDVVQVKRDEAAGAPSIKHFDVVEELGNGNYSSVYRVTRKADGAKFALKLVEKAQVDKIKKRHPNVHNEIKMEKRALAKLQDGPLGCHPNIIKCFQTFQDYYTLYYMQELCDGGEMWAQEKGTKSPTSKAPISVGFHSFRLIFGRAIIFWSGLERAPFPLERARAEHPR